ncbi:MAG: DUF3021 domain-containing protein [Clostridia bacterium]|nr:DUF3021 domain-containing protein [Clostridia bacterium]
MIKKALKLSGFGFLLGIVICNIIVALCSFAETGEILAFPPLLAERTGGQMSAYILQLLLAGLDGAVCMGTVVFYDIEKWPLLLSTVLHYLAVMLIYIPVSIILCWITGVKEMLIVTGIMTAAYFVIWVIMYSIYKKQVKELNRLQKEYRKGEEK